MSSTKTRPMHKGKDKSFKNYFGNKTEGQGFADKRKKKAAYDYLKLLKKEKQQSLRDGKDPAQHKAIPFLRSPSGKSTKGKKGHAFTAAEKIAKKRAAEKQKKKEEAENVRKAKDAAMKSYKERKRERHLKLCKKTSKGQPVMKYQMEVLLQKIKKQKNIID